MKQNITIEQIKELTKEQKKILNKWWIPQIGDKIASDWLNENDDMELQYFGCIRSIKEEGYLDTGGDIIWYKPYCLPLLNIGQMIEFISNHTGLIPEMRDVKKALAQVLIKCNDNNILRFINIELCNALWDATKEILACKEMW